MAEEQPSDNEKKEKTQETSKEQKAAMDVPPVITRHNVKAGRRKLAYSVNTGMMPLKDAKGETEAEMFYMAYELDGSREPAKRPLTFVFNGGPGSSSVWLHLGALGPKRVRMEDEGWMPAPPYQLIDNPHTWLDETDLVFIDPVGTGYSRATKPDDAKKFWNYDEDVRSVGEFIRMYLTRSRRWASPLFLAGESYGTTRAAGLAGHLVDKGIAFNGIILISTVLNFQTLLFKSSNDLPYTVYLPVYAATAWYHNKLPDDLQNRSLRDVLDEVEAWTENQYTRALILGDRMDDETRAEIVRTLARYTGLSEAYIDQSALRINIQRFCKELLRDQKRTVGRLDSRYKGIDTLAVTEFPEFDPSLTAITPPYTSAFNDYVRRQLEYESDRVYEILSYDVNSKWEWPRGEMPDASVPLRSALLKNPFMKVFLAMGLYDLATPYYATEYTFACMELDPELRDSVHRATYDAGHMLYLDVDSLAQLKKDVAQFIAVALPAQ
jgi:carboxypeptidase C (cathepsin A)